MRMDAITRLSAANPVPDEPAVESAERLRRLIDDMPLPDLSSRRSGGRARVGLRAACGVLTAMVAVVAVVLVVSGSTAPGVNIAAAAYAATSPTSGIVEAEFVVRSYQVGRLLGTLRQREWVDAATGQQRELTRVDSAFDAPRRLGGVLRVRPVHAVLDSVTGPHTMELWSSGSGREANVIRRIHTSRQAQGNLDFEGLQFDGLRGIELYRRYYREGAMRLVGRERVDGRLLWKLESNPSAPAARQRTAKLTVLVDPKTFLPVREMQETVSKVVSRGPLRLGRVEMQDTVAKAPTGLLRLGRVESELVLYRHLPASRADKAIFDLAVQHPGAHVLSSAMRTR